MSCGREWKVSVTDLYFHVESGDSLPSPQVLRVVFVFLHNTSPAAHDRGDKMLLLTPQIMLGTTVCRDGRAGAEAGTSQAATALRP